MKYSQLILLPFAALSWATAMTLAVHASVSPLVKADSPKPEAKVAPTGTPGATLRSLGLDIAPTPETATPLAVSTPATPGEARGLETQVVEAVSITPVEQSHFDAAAAAATPVTKADALPVVQLVEPGTGNAWSPAQLASALASSNADIAQATPSGPATSGWYVALTSELVFGYDIDLDGGDVTIPVVPAPGLPAVGTTTIPIDASIDTDTGFGINAAVGYRFDNIRAEFEVGYNNNSVDSVSVNDIETSVDGDIDNWKFLLNGYYDIPTNSRFSPYVGGGVGLAIVSANDVSATVPILGDVDIDDSSTSFLFQFKAGVGYDITDALNTFLGYRLMGIPGQSFEVLDSDLDADTVFIHSLQLGVRYTF
ncbi:MAG: outer membrane beta-barrel protein [Cyanobacteria bacterium P01_H01_bin.152]